jgi:hypothetical protein
MSYGAVRGRAKRAECRRAAIGPVLATLLDVPRAMIKIAKSCWALLAWILFLSGVIG